MIKVIFLIIINQIERITVANELKLFYEIKAPVEIVIEATQSCGCDRKINYEVLEVAGDSILKFLISLFLYFKYPDLDEN